MSRRSRSACSHAVRIELALYVHAERVAALAECRKRTVDGGSGRAQLVGRDRDEIQLELVEPDGVVVQPRLRDREGNALGNELEQLDVLLVERPGFGVPT